MWLCGCVARAASLRLCLRGCRARHYALRAAPTDQRTMNTYLNRKTLSVVAGPRTETGVRAMTPRLPLLRIHRQPRAPPSSPRGHCAIRLHAWSPPFRWFSHSSLMVLSWFARGSKRRIAVRGVVCVVVRRSIAERVDSFSFSFRRSRAIACSVAPVRSTRDGGVCTRLHAMARRR